MKKKVLTMLMAGAMMLSCFTGLTMSANAANTTDTSYSFSNINGEGYTAWRDKTDASRVYVYPQAGPTSQYTVQGRISPVASANIRSRTFSIPRGVQGSITNEIRKYADIQARLKINQYLGATGTTYGVWSPDSTKNYVIYE